MHTDDTTKTCSRCHETKPLTTEYYYYRKDRKQWRAVCKACHGIEGKLWRESNKDHATEYSRAYYENNKDKHAAACKRWEAAHLDDKRATLRRYRASKRESGGKHTGKDVQAQYARQKGLCYYCHKPVGQTYEADHIIPIKQGGTDDPDNIVIACRSCNRRKSGRQPHEWPEGNRLL